MSVHSYTVLCGISSLWTLLELFIRAGNLSKTSRRVKLPALPSGWCPFAARMNE